MKIIRAFLSKVSESLHNNYYQNDEDIPVSDEQLKIEWTDQLMRTEVI